MAAGLKHHHLPAPEFECDLNETEGAAYATWYSYPPVTGELRATCINYTAYYMYPLKSGALSTCSVTNINGTAWSIYPADRTIGYNSATVLQIPLLLTAVMFTAVCIL